MVAHQLRLIDEPPANPGTGRGCLKTVLVYSLVPNHLQQQQPLLLIPLTPSMLASLVNFNQFPAHFPAAPGVQSSGDPYHQQSSGPPVDVMGQVESTAAVMEVGDEDESTAASQLMAIEEV